MNSNTNSDSGIAGFLSGKGVVPQIILGLLAAIILYITMIGLEILYKTLTYLKGTRIDILPLTVSAEKKSRIFVQSPHAKSHLLLPFSDNERSGIEFSYTFFIWINPSSFRTEEGLLHVFHKGYPCPYPLMAPGVFVHSNKNSMRIYMNSSSTWNRYIDIDEVPVRKWVQIAIVAQKNAIDIYLNGNVTKRLSMNNATLYQNFGDLHCFSQRNLILSPNKIPSLNGESFSLFGTFNGQLSRLTYYSYALSYTEIQASMGLGPNPKTEDDAADTPPYLTDNWWVSKYDQNIK